MSTATTSFISKNLVELNHNFVHTAMVSHRGVPVSFAMDNSGKIFYSVLDLSSNQASQTAGQGQDQENDKHFWSSVDFNNPAISTLQFPKEIAQVGYGVVPNRLVGNYSDAVTAINDSA